MSREHVTRHLQLLDSDHELESDIEIELYSVEVKPVKTIKSITFQTNTESCSVFKNRCRSLATLCKKGIRI